MGAGSMPEVGRGVQLQRAIFVSYCQKEGGGKQAFKINLTPMDLFQKIFMVYGCHYDLSDAVRRGDYNCLTNDSHTSAKCQI
jgi:hypothetical protein